MDDAQLLSFTPVPLRARRNGWTPERQRRFVLALARGAGPAEAARSLGMSRQSAYPLREHQGAQPFAFAWDQALEFSREVRAAARAPCAGLLGPDTLLVPRLRRGRLIGFVRREDVSGMMIPLRRLDDLADKFGGK